jgi:hypothetical protein
VPRRPDPGRRRRHRVLRDSGDAEWERPLTDRPVGLPGQLKNGDIVVATRGGKVTCMVDAVRSPDPVVPAAFSRPAASIRQEPGWIVIGGVRIPRRPSA